MKCGKISLEMSDTMNMKDLRVVFMGTPDFARTILEGLIPKVNVVLVVSQPDSLVGRKKVLTPSPVKSLAIDNDIEVFTPEKIRLDYDRIIEAKPDMIITCAYGQIIPKVLLDLPEYGAINVHASLLPKLRGGAPIHHAIIDGLDETGITIMYMDEHMDSGNIITQESTKIEDNDTLDTLSLRLQKIGSNLLLKTIPSILDGTNESIKQDESDVTFGYVITKEDEKIDFNKTTREIYNQIRGLNFNPGAYFTLNGEIIKVYESKIGSSVGKISCINNIYKDGIGIGTKDGEIILTKIKPAGKRVLLVKDYLNGIKKEELIGAMCNEQ